MVIISSSAGAGPTARPLWAAPVAAVPVVARRLRSRCGRATGASSGGTNSSSLSARPDIEPPPWAIEAKGEARLEVRTGIAAGVVLPLCMHVFVVPVTHNMSSISPLSCVLSTLSSLYLPHIITIPTKHQPVCESLGIQQPIDLTRRACFRVGRSPNSDVRLLHATSSRRHALLFHHPNGSCYVVDCGSAHGTYVNGVRVKSGGSGGSGSSAGARSAAYRRSRKKAAAWSSRTESAGGP